MQIIEQLIIGKHSQETCEDGIVSSQDFIAVIDGSTSKSPVQIHRDMRNGRYAMLLVADFIRKMDAASSCEEFCRGVSELLLNIYRERKIDLKRLEKCPTERLTASAVVYSPRRKEIWMIGDCQCLINERLYTNGKPAEELLADKRADYIKKALSKGYKITDFQTVDKGREYILPELKASCDEQNITYAVIDGFEIPMDRIKTLRAEGEIVLASDGYPLLAATLEESEKLLQGQLSDDPLCIHSFKATKGLMAGNVSFDDRAYVRFLT
ncbi:hypothetical protein [Prevotella sp. KH2C16]|uniref:hypothetical protein n=1 Tax=Prevotella sp. KH2C16 TaxID=1855325 RepID=UPI000B822A03|nr:hypothetical protein [Prevotella sp. KH2C16]